MSGTSAGGRCGCPGGPDGWGRWSCCDDDGLGLHRDGAEAERRRAPQQRHRFRGRQLVQRRRHELLLLLNLGNLGLRLLDYHACGWQLGHLQLLLLVHVLLVLQHKIGSENRKITQSPRTLRE